MGVHPETTETSRQQMYILRSCIRQLLLFKPEGGAIEPVFHKFSSRTIFVSFQPHATMQRDVMCDSAESTLPLSLPG